MFQCAESTTKAVSAACEILSSIRANRVAISAVRNDILDEIERFCQQNNIELLKPPFGDNSAQAINEAEVGISEVAFGIAQTGTVVEATRDDATRLISSLPAVHVCFLNQKDLLLSLHEASSRLQAIYQDPKDRVSVTFISGPSRSGDIEMKITLGVHGPAESHVIVLSNSES